MARPYPKRCSSREKTTDFRANVRLVLNNEVSATKENELMDLQIISLRRFLSRLSVNAVVPVSKWQ